VLQTGSSAARRKAVPFGSAVFDFSVYIYADEAVLRHFVGTFKRFPALRDTSLLAFTDAKVLFHRLTCCRGRRRATAHRDRDLERTPRHLEIKVAYRRACYAILTKGAEHVWRRCRCEAVTLRSW